MGAECIKLSKPQIIVNLTVRPHAMKTKKKEYKQKVNTYSKFQQAKTSIRNTHFFPGSQLSSVL